MTTEDDIFIDKFVKKHITGYKEKPETSWSDMKKKLSENNIKSLKKKSVPLKNKLLPFIATIAIIPLIYFSLNNKPEKNKIKNTPTEKTEIKIKPTKKTDEKQKAKKKTTEIKTTKKPAETVTIKVTVPLHKKVIIKKQILLEDTVHNN